jgi:hypothetical protein
VLCSVLLPPFASTSACTVELVRFCPVMSTHCGIVITFPAFLSSMQQANPVLNDVIKQVQSAGGRVMVVGSLHPYILRMVRLHILCVRKVAHSVAARHLYTVRLLMRVRRSPRVRTRAFLLIDCIARHCNVTYFWFGFLPTQGVEPRWKGLNTAIPVIMVSKRTYR